MKRNETSINFSIDLLGYAIFEGLSIVAVSDCGLEMEEVVNSIYEEIRFLDELYSCNHSVEVGRYGETNSECRDYGEGICCHGNRFSVLGYDSKVSLLGPCRYRVLIVDRCSFCGSRFELPVIYFPDLLQALSRLLSSDIRVERVSFRWQNSVKEKGNRKVTEAIVAENAFWRLKVTLDYYKVFSGTGDGILMFLPKGRLIDEKRRIKALMAFFF